MYLDGVKKFLETLIRMFSFGVCQQDFFGSDSFFFL